MTLIARSVFVLAILVVVSGCEQSKAKSKSSVRKSNSSNNARQKKSELPPLVPMRGIKYVPDGFRPMDKKDVQKDRHGDASGAVAIYLNMDCCKGNTDKNAKYSYPPTILIRKYKAIATTEEIANELKVNVQNIGGVLPASYFDVPWEMRRAHWIRSEYLVDFSGQPENDVPTLNTTTLSRADGKFVYQFGWIVALSDDLALDPFMIRMAKSIQWAKLPTASI